jgi:magnesium chelatase family protein
MRRITVNLAPVDLPKNSGRLHFPIALGALGALGILVSSGQIDALRLSEHVFSGKLSLSGELRPVRGGLSMAFARGARSTPIRLVLPPGPQRRHNWYLVPR